MATSIYEVCEYLNNKYLKLEKSLPTEDLSNSINKLAEISREIREAYKSNFVGINLDETQMFKNAISLLEYDALPAKITTNAKLIQYKPDGTLSQFKNAHEEIKDLITSLNMRIRKYRNELETLQNSEEKEKLERILRIFKNGEREDIKLSGNITKEDYLYLVELLSQALGDASLPLEVVTDFLKDLNDSIAEFKFKQEKLNAVIEKKTRKAEFEKLTGGNLHEITPEATDKLLKGISPKKTPEYNYKKIYRLIDKLKTFYDGVLENPTIDETTPYDKYRIKKYYSIDSNGQPVFDLNIVLYDLINYINPSVIEEKYKNGKLKPRELDYIRSTLYKEIIRRCINLIPEDVFEETPEVPTVEEISQVFEKPQVVEPEYVNTELKPLDEESQAKVDYVRTIIHELHQRDEFKALSKYPSSFLAQIYKYNLTGYDLDPKALEIETQLIPQFNDSLKRYEETYEEIRTDKDFAVGFMDVLEGEQDQLINVVNKFINKYEMFIIEKEENIEEFSPNINNIILLYYQYSTGETPILDDVQKIVTTGQVGEDLIGDGLRRLEYISTITNGPNVKKISGTKHNLDDLRVYRYRQGDLRYLYLDINLDDDNKKVIKEKYGLTTDSIRLLLVPALFYKKGDNGLYDIYLTRIEKLKGIDENQVDSILWIKKIFGNKFTKETEKIAFELIDGNIAIRNEIGKGGDELGSY